MFDYVAILFRRPNIAYFGEFYPRFYFIFIQDFRTLNHDVNTAS